MVLGLPDLHVQARFLLALLSAPNPARTQDGLLAIAHRVFGLYGGLKRLARRAGSIAAVIAELDALCMLIGHAYVERENRDAWTQAVLGTLDAPVGARLATGETGLQPRLALEDSGTTERKRLE